MRHRCVASIVGASTLFLVLTGCMNVNMSQGTLPGVHDSGPIAPSAAPDLAPYQVVAGDMPQSVSGQPASRDDIATRYASLTSAFAGNKGVVWAHVVDADTGDTIFTDNAGSAKTPASIAKILTAVTAHYHLSEDATLDTGTSLAGSDLYLWGNGDLLLTTEAARTSIGGRASLDDLAAATSAALKERGITTVALHWAPHPFDGPAHLPEWATQEVADYEGRVGAYAIDSGRIPGARTFVTDPEKDVAQEFAALLSSHGITATLTTARAVGEDAQELARVQSATIGEQIRYMLYHSDNTLADQLCRLAATAAGNEASYSGSVHTVSNTLQSLGVTPSELILRDCSGLSTTNKILPETLTATLRAASRSDRADLRDLVRNLPWAGAQGTMARRFYDNTAIGNVQGKTGSLGSVSSLAGNVRTSTGRELVFAVGVDGTDDGVAYFMRPAIDEFIQSLTTL